MKKRLLSLHQDKISDSTSVKHSFFNNMQSGPVRFCGGWWLSIWPAVLGKMDLGLYLWLKNGIILWFCILYKMTIVFEER